ncbi:hypothetical protein [Megalodesulfovibrio paquesii]
MQGSDEKTCGSWIAERAKEENGEGEGKKGGRERREGRRRRRKGGRNRGN